MLKPPPPPTSEAARQPCLRTYLKVQTWIRNYTLSCTQWGWTLRHHMLEPVPTNKAIAHPKLLNLVSCSWTKGVQRILYMPRNGVILHRHMRQMQWSWMLKCYLGRFSLWKFLWWKSENNFDYYSPHQANQNFIDERISNALDESMVLLDYQYCNLTWKCRLRF